MGNEKLLKQLSTDKYNLDQNEAMTMIIQEMIDGYYEKDNPMRNFPQCKAAFMEVQKWGLRYVRSSSDIKEITSSNIQKAKEIIERSYHNHFYAGGIDNRYFKFEDGKILLGTDDYYGFDYLLGDNVYSCKINKSGETEYFNNRMENILHIGGADEDYDWKSQQIQVFNSKGIQIEQKIVTNWLAGHFCNAQIIKGYSITRVLESIEGVYKLFVKVYDEDQIKSYGEKGIEFDETKKPQEYTIIMPETVKVRLKEEPVDPSKIPDIRFIKLEIEKIQEGQYVTPDSKSFKARFEQDIKNWPDFKVAIKEMGLEDREIE